MARDHRRGAALVDGLAPLAVARDLAEHASVHPRTDRPYPVVRNGGTVSFVALDIQQLRLPGESVVCRSSAAFYGGARADRGCCGSIHRGG